MRAPTAPCVFVALLASLAPVARGRADACAIASSQGEQVFVADEGAVIHWDPARRIETFIRYARFDTRARDFGFIVPTPSVPTLSGAPRELFEALEEIVRPEEEWRTRAVPYPTLGCLSFAMRSQTVSATASVGGAIDPVRVLSTQTVSGYDATVLEADSPDALAQWLTRHGYASSPTLARWLAPYVARRWKLTAFRVHAANANEPWSPATAPVRMTFETDRPFYPYREPEEQRRDRGAARSLRVHFLSTTPMRATIGEAARWPGELYYRADPSGLVTRLSSMVGPAIAAGTWLSTFDDRSSPRPGTDELYFSPADDTERRRPPPIVHTRDDPWMIPVDWIGMGAVAALWLWRRTRKRRATKSAP